MIFIYSVTGAKLEHRKAGVPAPVGGVPVALVDGGELELLIPLGDVDSEGMRVIAAELGAVLPLELQETLLKLVEEDTPEPAVEVDEAQEAPSLADLKFAWKDALSATMRVARKEFNAASASVKEQTSKVDKEGVGSSVKSAYAKMTIKTLTKMHRNLFSVSAKLVEERLCTDLENMDSEARTEFYELYRREVEALPEGKDRERLESWDKPIRRICVH